MKPKVGLKYFVSYCRLMENRDNTLASLLDCMKSNPMTTGALFISKLSTASDELPYSNLICQSVMTPSS